MALDSVLSTWKLKQPKKFLPIENTHTKEEVMLPLKPTQRILCLISPKIEWYRRAEDEKAIIAIGSIWYTAWVDADNLTFELQNTLLSLELMEELKALDAHFKHGEHKIQFVNK